MIRRMLITLVALIVLGVAGIFAASLANPVGTQQFLLNLSESWAQIWRRPGKGAGFRAVSALYGLGILKPVVMQTNHGFPMELDARDLVTMTILRTGSWETENINALKSVLKSGAYVVDIGAHVGFYSLLAASISGPSGKVIAVEPNPFTAARLRRNIALNPKFNIEVQEVAGTDVPRKLEFFIADITNTGLSSLAEANAESAQKVEVRGVPIDSVIEGHLPRVDVIKMDVEGAEMQVLRGLSGTLTKYHPVIMSELQDNLLRNLGSSFDEVAGFLKSQGYREQPIGQGDFLWIPVAGN